MRCPICKTEIMAKPGAPRPASFPFCSARCKAIDLGKWLTEDYRVPVTSDDDEDGDGDDPELAALKAAKPIGEA